MSELPFNDIPLGIGIPISQFGMRQKYFALRRVDPLRFLNESGLSKNWEELSLICKIQRISLLQKGKKHRDSFLSHLFALESE
jgi:hypothetical protein